MFDGKKFFKVFKLVGCNNNKKTNNHNKNFTVNENFKKIIERFLLFDD